MCWWVKKKTTNLTPTPNPVEVKLQPCGIIDLNLMSSILQDKLEEIGQGEAPIYLPDSSMKVYSKAEVLTCYELVEVSSIPYIAEAHDCDDFAAELFGKFAGLVWTDVHALNWFVDETNTFWWVEPQTRVLSQTIGTEYAVRFFLGR